MTRHSWQRTRAELRTVATLAIWRWRQPWLLLLMTALGTLTATMLICAVPLLSAVMTSAGLRATLRAAPTNAQIETHLGLSAFSSSALAAATQQVSTRFTQDLASYVNTRGDLSAQFEMSGWLLTGNTDQVVLHGASMHAAAAHLQVLQGRLPTDNGTQVEAALTQSAANYMHVQLGSTFSVLGEASVMSTSETEATPVYQETLQLRVVGIFQTLPGDAYWQDQTFQEPPPLPHMAPVPFHVLISSAPFLHWIDTLTQQYQTRGLSFAPSSTYFLTYSLATEHMSGAQLGDLIKRLGLLQADMAHLQSSRPDPYSRDTAFPYIAGANISGAVLHDPFGPELLDAFQNEVQLGQTTMLILALQIAGLLFFFIAILAQTQVEQQASALALLRSRGASGQQIVAVLFLQGLLLCLLLACLAPLLALSAVRLIAPLLLPSIAHDALDVLPSTLPALLRNDGPYALAALLIVLGTQLLALILALRGNVLTLRRETARSTRRPLWLRLRLDLALTTLAFLGYGFSFYTQSTQQLLSNQAQLLLLTPLNLLAPLCLLLACLLFFLRLFPLLLRSFLKLIASRRDAPSMLAVAQIARSPRQPVRLTLLLGLALTFAIFTLVFAASQSQRSQDLAAYQAGADFSGYLPLNFQVANPATQASVMARYRALPGITSVSAGFADQEAIQVNPGTPDEGFRPLQLRAVNSQTFTQTALWVPQASTQSLKSLLASLTALRSQALQQKAVPALLSQSAWQILHLHPGEVFHIFTGDGTRDPIPYLAVASIAHVPPANESVESGMLVDLTALQAVYAQQHQILSINYIWLQSSANSSALAQVRHELNSAPLSLTNLSDRQMLVQLNATNPLVLNLLALLSMGVCAAILLALLANLLLPILNQRARLTTFAFLRALGARPAQVLQLLLWEQGWVLATALLLGMLLGFPLALIAVPPLIVNGIPAASSGANAVYLAQGLLPARVIFPSSLLLALAFLLILCLLTLWLMSKIAMHLALGQQLRLNED